MSSIYLGPVVQYTASNIIVKKQKRGCNACNYVTQNPGKFCSNCATLITINDFEVTTQQHFTNVVGDDIFIQVNKRAGGVTLGTNTTNTPNQFHFDGEESISRLLVNYPDVMQQDIAWFTGYRKRPIHKVMDYV